MSEIISIDPLVILVSMLNTFVLFLIIKHFLFDKVNAVLAERQKDIENAIQDAETQKHKAYKTLKECEDKITLTNEEAIQIVSRARRKGESIVFEAQAQATDIKNKAAKDIEFEKHRAVIDLKDEISELAIFAAAKITQKEFDEEANKKLIEEFLAM